MLGTCYVQFTHKKASPLSLFFIYYAIFFIYYAMLLIKFTYYAENYAEE